MAGCFVEQSEGIVGFPVEDFESSAAEDSGSLGMFAESLHPLLHIVETLITWTYRVLVRLDSSPIVSLLLIMTWSGL